MKNNPRISDRDKQIGSDFKKGTSIIQLSKSHGVTPQRIHQIISRQGFTWKDGGRHVKSTPKRLVNEKLDKKNKDSRAQELYGVNYQTYKDLKAKSAKLLKAYTAKRHTARFSKIEFKLTLSEWFDIWLKSGKSELFGRGAGKYCITRKNNTGEFSFENVEVVSYEKFMSLVKRKTKTN